MSEKLACHLRVFANLLLFLFNLALCALLLVSLYFVRWSGGQITQKAQQDAALLGMDLYSVRDPFALFVNKEFPRDRAFTLTRYGSPCNVVVSEQKDMDAKDSVVDDDDRGVTKRVISVDLLDTDFRIKCRYYVYSQTGNVDVAQFEIYRDDRAYFDLNADGGFDSVMTTGKDGGRTVQVVYKGEWRGVDPGLPQDTHHKHLMGGQAVEFDLDQGIWIPSNEADTTTRSDTQKMHE